MHRTSLLLVFLALAVPAASRANKMDVKVFDVGQEASAIAVSPDGAAIWFTQGWGGKLGRVDTATGAIAYQAIPHPGLQVADLVMDAFGDLWFVEAPERDGGGSSYLCRYHPETQSFDVFVLNTSWWNGYGGSIWNGPQGMALGPDGKVWFNDLSAAAVVGSIDPATAELAAAAAGIGAVGGSGDVAATPSGSVWLTAFSHGLWTRAPGATAFTPTGITVAGEIAADRVSGVWVSANDGTLPGTVLTYVAEDGTYTFHPEVRSPGWFGVFAVDARNHVWIPRDIYESYGSAAPDTLVEFDPRTGTQTSYDVPFKPEYVTVNGSQMAFSRSAMLLPATIGLVVDRDADGDGVLSKQDCNDADPTIYPGAPEIRNDGIDQDCNGYDLTIAVTKATFATSAKQLIVQATSAYRASAALSVQGFGAMAWDPLLGLWGLNKKLSVAPPATVSVCGPEGCVAAPVAVK